MTDLTTVQLGFLACPTELWQFLILDLTPPTLQQTGIFVLSFIKSQCSPARKDYFFLLSDHTFYCIFV